MTTALNLAIYAKMRAADTLPRQGTSMVDLLGAPNENDPTNLQLVECKLLSICFLGVNY